MKYLMRMLLLSLLICLNACANFLSQRTAETHKNNANPAYALTHARLITMGPQGDLDDHTLILRQGKIITIGPTDATPIPQNVKVMNMQGKTLLPGFVDAHVHLSHERDLLLFLRHGITSVRNLAASKPWAQAMGFPNVLALREQVKSHQLLGPNIYTCGHMLDGDPPQNAITQAIANETQARQAVRDTKTQGYDCVKVYNLLGAKEFDAIVDEAQKQDIPVLGHVPFQVSIDKALKAKMQSIEHLNAYVENFAGHYRIPEDQIEVYGQKTREAGVFNCPTLVVWDRHPPYKPDEIQAMRDDHRHRYLPFFLKASWEMAIPYLYQIDYPDWDRYPSHMLKISQNMMYGLTRGGAKMLVGTDANLTGIYPGSDYFRELGLMVDGGLSTRTVLEAATRNGAEAMGWLDSRGSLEVGKVAEIAVFSENPLENIHHVHQIEGVFVQGQWLSRETLDAWIKDSLNGFY